MRSSESDRAIICPSSLVLPRTSSPNARRDAAAKYGTAMHAWVETGTTDDDAVMKKVVTSGIKREKYWSGGNHEVTFAIDLRTEQTWRYDGPREGADAWKLEMGKLGPYMLTGTIDFLGVHKGRPWVDDLKTGRWPVDPEKSKQLLSYLLLSWLEEGKPTDAVYYRSITQWPRYPLGDLPERKGPYEVTGMELQMHLEDLRYAVETPDDAHPTIQGCRFCECKPACEAYKDMEGILGV
jgi:hypothetical protein